MLHDPTVVEPSFSHHLKFNIEGKPYTVGTEQKAAVNIACEAFSNGWHVFKRKANENDEALLARIVEAIRAARAVRAHRTRSLL